MDGEALDKSSKKNHTKYKVTMKSFESLKSYCAIAGINSPQSTQKHLFNLTNVIFFICIGINFFFTLIYVCYEVDSFDENLDAAFAASGMGVCVIFFATLVWKMPQQYRFFDDFENIIEQSKAKQLIN